MNAYDLLSPQEEELEALRSIWGDEWVDLPPQKTAWNVKGEEGWWTVRVKGSDERVSVKLKGRLTKVSSVRLVKRLADGSCTLELRHCYHLKNRSS